ncbi:aspartyl-phosphate phosphatase Spo0E family protein [Bacillus sp. REN3]|uniref:aspartyl-phosphate phosphatase Spo0E family protein n=1 Tax=Bacillus sp. REN3 TaxID=2802440 RepID=UPI001AED8696|nr:aspartyl-phosphate phosphatase Spo0E family protein [Bacillus sp. REN3]
MCAEALLRDIEKYRKEMVDLAAKTSLSNQNVIDVSTKLDCLLNKYYHLSSDKTALY